MTEAFMLIAGFFLGALLGAFYFGGLWLTLKRLHQCRQPTLLSLGSFAARIMVCAMGFYLIIGKGIEMLFFALAGFILTKIILIRKLSCPDNRGPPTYGGLLK